MVGLLCLPTSRALPLSCYATVYCAVLCVVLCGALCDVLQNLRDA